MTIQEEILKLKQERNAIILAHNYTIGEVQDVADFVGDSLELSRKAALASKPVIVFCGVRFMAETAKILSPGSIVIQPVLSAGCPMADMAGTEEIKAYKAAHPNATLIAYVNTTAETKTLVDICVTSGNAEKIVSSLPDNAELLFLPDANLGANVSQKLGKEMDLWAGHCPIHNEITPAVIEKARREHPGAYVLVHPECKPETVAAADEALSTGGMLSRVRELQNSDFIVGTEIGILHRLRKENPGKCFYPLDPAPICENMKKITLESILASLKNLEPRIELSEETIRLARSPIDKMLKA